MPRKLAKTKNNAKGHQSKTRSSVKRHKLHRRPASKQIGTAAGRIAENLVKELVPVDRNTGISASYAKNGNGQGLIDAVARITVGVFGLTSMLIAAPVMFGVQAFIHSRDRQVEADDLKSREYRDEAGRTHHHTRTFLRDHAWELRPLAA